jgi:hypothetical protein
VVSFDLAFGNVNFITFGFAKVEIIRKNKNKKNIISLKDEVGISG